MAAGRWTAAPVAKLFVDAAPTTCGLPGASILPLAEAEESPTWDAEPAPGYPAAMELCADVTAGLAVCAVGAAAPPVLAGAFKLGERLIMRRP